MLQNHKKCEKVTKIEKKMLKNNSFYCKKCEKVTFSAILQLNVFACFRSQVEK